MNARPLVRGAYLVLAIFFVSQAPGCRDGRALAELSDAGAADSDTDSDTDADASTYSDTDTDSDSDTDSGTSEYACDGEPTLDFLHTVEIDETWTLTNDTMHVAQTFVPNASSIESIEIMVQEPNADLGAHELLLIRHAGQVTVWSDQVEVPQSTSTPIAHCVELGGVGVEIGETYSLHFHVADDADAANPLVVSGAGFDAYSDGAAWSYEGAIWDEAWVEQPMDLALAIY